MFVLCFIDISCSNISSQQPVERKYAALPSRAWTEIHNTTYNVNEVL